MKTQVTESHKSPAQPLQCLGSLGTFWKAVCPFWLSWVLASLCSHSGKGDKVFLHLTVQNEDLCRTHEHTLTIPSSASDSHWCAKVGIGTAAPNLYITFEQLKALLWDMWDYSLCPLQAEDVQSHNVKGNATSIHTAGSVRSWDTLHPSDGIWASV